MFPRVEVVHLCRLLPNCFMLVSFSAFIRLMLSSLKLSYMNSFKILHGKPELSTTIINIITSKPSGPYLPVF